MTGIIEGKRAEQMTAFGHALKQYGYKGKKPATWLDAFFALRGLLEQLGSMAGRNKADSLWFCNLLDGAEYY